MKSIVFAAIAVLTSAVSVQPKSCAPSTADAGRQGGESLVGILVVLPANNISRATETGRRSECE